MDLEPTSPQTSPRGNFRKNNFNTIRLARLSNSPSSAPSAPLTNVKPIEDDERLWTEEEADDIDSSPSPALPDIKVKPSSFHKKRWILLGLTALTLAGVVLYSRHAKFAGWIKSWLR